MPQYQQRYTLYQYQNGSNNFLLVYLICIEVLCKCRFLILNEAAMALDTILDNLRKVHAIDQYGDCIVLYDHLLLIYFYPIQNE